MTDFTLYPAPGAPAWFAEHSLITNSTIRNYLKQYSQHAWPEITKLTLIYGIIALDHNYKGQTLSLQQLKQVVKSSATTLVVQSNVPQLQRQILNLQNQLDNVFDKLAVEPLQMSQSLEELERSSSHLQQQQLHIGSPQQQLQVQLPHLHQQQQQWQPPARPQQQKLQQNLQQKQVPPPPIPPPRQAGLNLLRARQGRSRNPAITAPKPSDAWRQGEPSGFTSPPRVHCRSQDNQGATNPIYPDWWLAEPTAEQLAEQQRQQLLQQQQQQKPPRAQSRLAYSVPKPQQQQDITADDLVTAEYLIVPGSGYGQHTQQLVPSEHDPPITITHITPSTIATNHAVPLQQQQHQHGAEQASKRQHNTDRQLPPPAAPITSAISSTADSSVLRRHQAPVLGRGLPHLNRVESKIKQAVAASKQQAAAKQDQRQRLLSSVIATSSHQEQQQQQQRARAVTVEESCPPAATAEQFIANPWTSWFLPGSAPDLAARSGTAMAAAAAEEEEAQQAHLDQQELELAGCMDAASNSSNLDCTAVADLVWLQPATGEAAAVGLAADSCMQPASAGGGSRGALSDITHNLNQQQPAGGGTDDSSCKQHRQGIQGSESSFSSFAFAKAHLAEYSNALQPSTACRAVSHCGTASQEQQQEQRQAWAADFGHLDSAQLQAAVEEVQQAAQPSGQRRQPQQRQQWSQKFCEETAFSHHPARDGQAATAGSSGDHALAAAEDAAAATAAAAAACTFLMSPAALDDLLAAGKAFNQHPAAAAEDAANSKHAAGASLPHEAVEQDLHVAGMSLLEHWQQLAAGAQAKIEKIASSATEDTSQSAAAAAGADLLRLPGDVQETRSPTKRAESSGAVSEGAAYDFGSSNLQPSRLGGAGLAGDESAASPAELAADADVAGAAELADEYLLGLQDTSRMLQQALQQHSSVMQLVGFLDDTQGMQMRQGQPEAADAVGSSAEAHTAAWVAAAAARHKEHDD